MPILEIPPGFLPCFRVLSAINKPDFELLLERFRSSVACLNANQLARRVATDTQLDPVSLLNVINMVVSLRKLIDETGLPVSILQKDIQESLGDLKGFRNEAPEIGAEIASKIGQLLELPGALALISRADDVTGDNACSFLSCRILTDLRPVFGDSVQQKPEAIAVMQTLKFVFYRDFGQKEIFLTLDDEQLELLKRQVDRALDKSKTLRELIKSTNIPCFELEIGEV